MDKIMSEESLLNEYTSLNRDLEKNDLFIQKLLRFLFIFIFALIFFYLFNIINSTNSEILNLSIFNNYIISEDNTLYFDIILYSVFFVLSIFIFIVLYGLRQRDSLISRILEITDLLNEIPYEFNQKE